MKKAYVVGIAGGTASGKSTFCDLLVESLNKANPTLTVEAIHMDSYFKPDGERPYVAAPVTGKMYEDHNHPTSMDLPALGKDLEKMIAENKFDIIIVEGLMTLQDNKICDMLDLKLFVECRADERIVRRIKRNMQWGLTIDEITNVYLDMVRYRHDEYVEGSKWRADIIINGSMMPENGLKMVSSYILTNKQ